MPIYEYSCRNCGELWEELVPHNQVKRPCPNCYKLCKRIISLSNFQLKGEGWAKDNYTTGKDIEQTTNATK